MTKWRDSQKKLRGDFCKLLQERINKVDPRRTVLGKNGGVAVSNLIEDDEPVRTMLKGELQFDPYAEFS
jgi:hypothetical protein